MSDIEISQCSLICEHCFFGNNEEFEAKGIVGQPPSGNRVQIR